MKIIQNTFGKSTSHQAVIQKNAAVVQIKKLSQKLFWD